MRIPSQLRHLMALLFLALGFCAPLHAQLGHEWQRLPDMPFDPDPFNPPIYYRDQTIYFVSETTQTIIWSSIDGRQWQRFESGFAEPFNWPFVFQQKVWFQHIRDNPSTGSYDLLLYSSADFTSWTLESTLPEIGYPYSASVIPSHLGLLAYTEKGTYSSNDGIGWTLLSNQSIGIDFGLPWGFAGKVWNYIVGNSGLIDEYSDGVNRNAEYPVPFGQVTQQPIVCGDRMVFLESFDMNYRERRGIWESTDGAHWSAICNTTPFAGPSNLVGVYGKGGLWILGAWYDIPLPKEQSRSVWFSPEAVPQLQWEPGFYYFGNVMLNAPPPVQSVQLYNSTQQTVHFGSAVFTGDGASQFGFAQPPDLSPLPAHTTRTLQLQFHPLATEYYWAALQLTTDVTSETTRTFTLAGTGIADAPVPSLLPATLDFGSRLPDTGPSEPKYLTLRNDGTSTLTLSKYSFSSGYPADFTLQSTDTTPLAPFSSRTVAVQFNPTQHYGLRRTTLHLSYSDYGGASVELTGRSGPPAHWQGLDWQLLNGHEAQFLGDWSVPVVPFKHAFYALSNHQIYRTTNFLQWTLMADTSPFQPSKTRSGLHPEIVAFRDKLWAFDRGGWTSDDGVTWTTLTLPTAMTTIEWPLVVSFNQQVWVLGGLRDGAPLNEIWSSSDGVHWTGPIAGPFFSYGNFSSAGAVGEFMIWLGRDGAHESQAWYTADGVHWSRHPFFDRCPRPAITLHQNYLWMALSTWTPGTEKSGYSFCRSADGLTWEWVADNTVVPFRDGGTLASDGQSLFYFGGTIWTDMGEDIPPLSLWVSTPSANAVGAWACYQ